MIRRSLVEPVIGAVVTLLRASTSVTGLAAGGAHNNVPQGTAKPYVEVTVPFDQRVDTFGRFGSQSSVTLKVVTQDSDLARGDLQGIRLMNACIQALGGQGGSNTIALSSPYAGLGISWDSCERYTETVNGVTTRYHVGQFRVWAEQTS